MEIRPYVRLQSNEYDMFSADALERELSILESGDAVVDFADVAYVDSSALTRLIRVLKRMQSNDECSTLSFVNVSPAIRRIFELTALNGLFQLE